MDNNNNIFTTLSFRALVYPTFLNYFILFLFREQKRRKLDREILHLEFAAQGLEGTLADKRRAAARVRNSKLIEVSLNLVIYLYKLGLFFNMNWTKKLSLFGGNWKSLIFKISIGINDYTHKNSKNQVDLIFQLFVYILQQF